MLANPTLLRKRRHLHVCVSALPYSPSPVAAQQRRCRHRHKYARTPHTSSLVVVPQDRQSVEAFWTINESLCLKNAATRLLLILFIFNCIYTAVSVAAAAAAAASPHIIFLPFANSNAHTLIIISFCCRARVPCSRGKHFSKGYFTATIATLQSSKIYTPLSYTQGVGLARSEKADCKNLYFCVLCTVHIQRKLTASSKNSPKCVCLSIKKKTTFPGYPHTGKNSRILTHWINKKK